ncbi:823_t:CDS:2, partial [Gigaspora rosea]
RHRESHLNTEKLSKILEIEFNNTFILYNTDIIFKLRQFNKAISDLDIAINLKPNTIEMLILRGKIYFFLEKYDLALFDFIKALELEPNNIFAQLYTNEIFDGPLLLKNNNSIFTNFDIEISEYRDLDIDDEVKALLDNDKYKLSWIPYDFENIRVIGKGGFAIVYGARWISNKKTDFNSNQEEKNPGYLDETKNQFSVINKYGKESSDDHKYKSRYFQKNSNSLLIPLP